MDDDTPALLLPDAADDGEAWLLLSRAEEDASLLLDCSVEEGMPNDEEDRAALLASWLLARELATWLLLPAEEAPLDDEPVPTAGSTGCVHASAPQASNNVPTRACIMWGSPVW